VKCENFQDVNLRRQVELVHIQLEKLQTKPREVSFNTDIISVIMSQIARTAHLDSESDGLDLGSRLP
jgi:hypothetical protein